MDFSLVPEWILFAVTLVCAISTNTMNAFYIKRKIKNNTHLFLYNSGIGLFCAIALFIIGGFNLKISGFSVLLAVAFGIANVGLSVFMALSFKKGPYGFSNVIVNMSTAITALSGAIFWQEELSVFKIIGIVLMLCCFVLAVDLSNKDGKKANIGWFICAVLSLCCSASIGIMQKIHQSSAYKAELMPFLVMAFVTNAVASFVVYLVLRVKNPIPKEQTVVEGEKKLFVIPYLLIIAMFICGVCGAGNNAINLFLSGKIDSAIFFPIVNGVPLLASLLVSVILFREKLAKKQVSGLLVGLVAIACLFF